MKHPAHGFTLIELMIVVVIIAILAAVALPAFQNYSTRAKISEVILALGACRTTITEVYQSGNAPPGPGNWGCEGASSRYVAGISTDANGVVTATLTGIAGDVNGKTVTLAPLIQGIPASVASDMGKSISGWICGGGSGTNLAMNYLPASCRG
jgi:type IV pilus assembly protein PilA